MLKGKNNNLYQTVTKVNPNLNILAKSNVPKSFNQTEPDAVCFKIESNEQTFLIYNNKKGGKQKFFFLNEKKENGKEQKDFVLYKTSKTKTEQNQKITKIWKNQKYNTKKTLKKQTRQKNQLGCDTSEPKHC